ncbi:GNAT family N-acetyltransferase [Pseudanabaena galeata UHCC 0370]|jgi:UDP-2,4-diacetamido-2,4,6-trideoxy-beta-L-altropyranose hydrolase|uniref:GNAT family N-acetyltransferase n=1 Tax=Pseudanabaena galeata UHCC 0370 TaxID=3110310 RepID=A0ABU5TLW0_9CYAN|nr:MULTISPECIES: GNAT family N-acetyltransferase [Pseudanabaena]MEA5479320.1 GNAT family N-acetyltransferase [Pseudanabaena galeata UHCC 0370]MEA5487701.1 GNAT family N-acetyltransferase [Pseudanabaena sp. CCNP1317]WGS70830.1 GNAT family N-acetyltransferase [Pseudanabaena galeata CCNP1313]
MNLTDKQLKLRDAKYEDCELLWKWANDPISRAASFSSDYILWEDHLKWFNEKLNSVDCYYFIAVNKLKQPVGQIRFDIDKELQALVSISVDHKYRGQGYGKLILQMAISKLFQHISVIKIRALIKSGNVSSIKLFESGGFKKVNCIPTHSALEYIYENN